eukprot:ANDGO_05782.mRNA.1 alpha/beta hydrolase fold-1 domain-containing protein
MSKFKDEGFRRFRSTYSLTTITLSRPFEASYSYYDVKPPGYVATVDCPSTVVCLPGVIGGGEQFFKIAPTLASHGHRVVCVTPPPVYDLECCIASLEAFLTSSQGLRLLEFHILGVGLGGFLAQVYAQTRPQKVLSLVIANSFASVTEFRNTASCVDLVRVTPGFILKRALLKRFPQPAQTQGSKAAVAEQPFEYSVEFMVHALEAMTQEELACRITLHTTEFPMMTQAPILNPSRVTSIETLDDMSIPPVVREEMVAWWEDGLARAVMKHGGPWPWIEESEEFCMLVNVHLRRMETEIEHEKSALASGSPAVEEPHPQRDQEPEPEPVPAIKEALQTNEATQPTVLDTRPQPSILASSSLPDEAAAPVVVVEGKEEEKEEEDQEKESRADAEYAEGVEQVDGHSPACAPEEALSPLSDGSTLTTMEDASNAE